jgi:hypothetical protein
VKNEMNEIVKCPNCEAGLNAYQEFMEDENTFSIKDHICESCGCKFKIEPSLEYYVLDDFDMATKEEFIAEYGDHEDYEHTIEKLSKN